VYQTFGASLNAAVAILAQFVCGISQNIDGEYPLVVDLVDAFLLDADGALQATFSPIDDTGPADYGKTMLSLANMYVVFFRHFLFFLGR
jgi:hypothetical protein